LNSGKSVAECPLPDLGLAVNHRVKKGEEWVDEPCFVDVTLWGRTAEYASEKLSKGSTVCIQGRLKLDSWEQDGQKRTKLKVVADTCQSLSQAKQQGAAPVRVTPARQPARINDGANVPFKEETQDD
jgi:single-strand DNA-binding protein